MYQRICFVFVLLSAILTACSTAADEPQVLRLATTTSTDDSGLLAAILPNFEERYNARVDVIAVGTGQALALGKSGDVDVVLVHARTLEDQFVADEHGTERYDVMFNDFVIVGPEADPAGITGIPLAAEGLTSISEVDAIFVSRGDDSGTHTKELSLWEAAGITPGVDMDWYKALGQGMGGTLLYANETGAYTLSDRGTLLSMQGNLSNLVILVGGGSIEENQDPTLFNPYGVIPINPDKGKINDALAHLFVEWLTSVETQQLISEFGVDDYGQPLFHPDSDAWRNR